MAPKRTSDADQTRGSQEWKPPRPIAQPTNLGASHRDLRRPLYSAGSTNGVPTQIKTCEGCEQDRPLCWFKGYILQLSPSSKNPDRCVSCKILDNAAHILGPEVASLAPDIAKQLRRWIATLGEESGAEYGIPDTTQITNEAKALAKKVSDVRFLAFQRRKDKKPSSTGHGAGAHEGKMANFEIQSESPANHDGDHPRRSRDPQAKHDKYVQSINDVLYYRPSNTGQSSKGKGKGKRTLVETEESETKRRLNQPSAPTSTSRSENYKRPSGSGVAVPEEIQQYAGYKTLQTPPPNELPIHEKTGSSNSRARDACDVSPARQTGASGSNPGTTSQLTPIEVPNLPTSGLGGLQTPPRSGFPIQGKHGSSNNLDRDVYNASPTRQTGASSSNRGEISQPEKNSTSNDFLDVDNLLKELSEVVQVLTTIHEVQILSPAWSKHIIALNAGDYTFAQASSLCKKLSGFRDLLNLTKAGVDALE